MTGPDNFRKAAELVANVNTFRAEHHGEMVDVAMAQNLHNALHVDLMIALVHAVQANTAATALAAMSAQQMTGAGMITTEVGAQLQSWQDVIG